MTSPDPRNALRLKVSLENAAHLEKMLQRAGMWASTEEKSSPFANEARNFFTGKAAELQFERLNTEEGNHAADVP